VILPRELFSGVVTEDKVFKNHKKKGGGRVGTHRYRIFSTVSMGVFAQKSGVASFSM
jgi:hypothetical protein